MTSLSGKNSSNTNSLLGSNQTQKGYVTNEMKDLKRQLLNNYLIPIFSEQWDVLYKNLFFIDKFKKKIETYYSFYKSDDFLLYLDLINMLEILVEKHKLLEYTERKITGTTKEQVISMIFKTTAIKLMPEYELYDSIIGKPRKECKETYKDEIICDIHKLLKEPNIDYTRMRMVIQNKFK
jgi:hypothetical protein